MRKAFFVFSRIDSSRLPAKAMLRLGDDTILGTILETLKKSDKATPVVLTSTREVDDCIVSFAEARGVKTFRGSLEDVSLRIVGAIEKYDIEAFYRVNGDSPCVDLELINEAAMLYESDDYEFVSNLINRHYPYGVSVELFHANTYVDIQKQFHTHEQREHATSFFYQHLENFRYREINNNIDYSDVSLTIDTLDDYLRFLKILNRVPDFLELSLAQN